MKKYILLAASLLLTISSFAEEVSKLNAEAVARKVLGTGKIEFVSNNSGEVVSGTATPTYYVFNGNGRWAIISADNCAVPVLMHGEGTLDMNKIPDNMRSLLDNIDHDITVSRKNKNVPSLEVRQKWAEMTTDTKSTAAPLEILVKDKDGNYGTALWNQGSPYNDNCPSVSGTKCPTGCLATAMSIIMRFHQWPETGKGELDAYQTTSYKINIPAYDLDGYAYHWSSLPASGNFLTDDSKSEVADLLYQCGIMVQMNYAPGGSGASSSVVTAALAEHMSYSPDAVELNRSEFSNQQWFNMIKAELDNNHPVLYTGQNLITNSGHAFVCDGYNSNNEVHINWGWGGYCNSWFAVCYLGPVNGEGSAVYSRSDSAIFGLVPVTSDYDPSEMFPNLYVAYDEYSGGITLDDGCSISKNVPFSITISSLWNLNASTYSGVAKAALFDKSGNIKEFISDGIDIELVYQDLYDDLQFDCKITQDIEMGDYISIMCSYGDGEWAHVRKYWYDTDYTVTRMNVIDLTVIDTPSQFTAGQIYYPSLIFGTKTPSSVTWYYDNVETDAEYITIEGGVDHHIFKVVVTYTDGSHETITKKVMVQ